MMISAENWENFIAAFFGTDERWIAHVTKNWNHLTNTSGCGCAFVEDGPSPCAEYLRLVDNESEPTIHASTLRISDDYNSDDVNLAE